MFSFQSDEYFNRSEGWYIDDILLWKRTTLLGAEGSESEFAEDWAMKRRVE